MRSNTLFRVFLVTSLLFLGVGFAEEELALQVEQATPKQKMQANKSCGKGPHPLRVDVRHIESKGIGYDKGYTSLDLFLSPVGNNYRVPFLDLRGHVFNDGKFAYNIGLGFRELLKSRIFGLNIYYDYRNTHHHNYNQLSFGLESLGRVWDFRLNSYFTISDHKSSFFDTDFKEFEGNNAILRRKFEFSYGGANAEIGAHINKYKKAPIYLAAGPYYLHGEDQTLWGGQARATIDFLKYIKIEGNTSYDHVFKWIGQGQLSITVPFGKERNVKKRGKLPCSQELLLADRLLQRVDRNEIIPVNTKHISEVAIDPTTQDPFFFIFVDNESHSNGTFESPYNTLVAAQTPSLAGDIIYVFPGNGTTSGMSDGITLKQNQKLWGSGTEQMLLTQHGLIEIPALTSTSPQITNTTGDGITLASGTEISGITVTRAFNNGISGTDVSGVVIKNSTIFGSGVDTSLHGNAINFMETVPCTLALDNLSILDNWEGIVLTASGNANVDISITDSELSVNGDPTSRTNFGNGVNFELSDNASITAKVFDNTFKNNKLNGIIINSTSSSTSPLVFNIKNNLIEGNGFDAVLGNFSGGSAPVNADIENNIIVGNSGNVGKSAIVNIVCGTSDSSVVVSGNQITRNFSEAVGIDGNCDLNVLMVGNTISENAGIAFRYHNNAAATHTRLEVANNIMEANKGDGISIGLSQDDSFNLIATNNSIEGNSGYGINLPSGKNDVFGAIDLNIGDNDISENSLGGIFVSVNQTTAFNFVATNNNILGNRVIGKQAAGGIDIELGTFDTVMFSASGNNISGNDAAGIALNCPKGTPGVVNFASSDNVISGNGSFGIVMNSSGADVSTSITGNELTDNQSDGIGLFYTLNLNNNTSATEISQNTISSNLGNGLHFQANGPSIGQESILVVDSNTITYNQQDGVSIATVDLTIAEIISNNTISFNHRNGLENTADGSALGGAAYPFIINNVANNNFLSGIRLDSADFGIMLPEVNDNSLANNNALQSGSSISGFQAISGDFGYMCLNLSGNTSDTGYYLNNANYPISTFNLIVPPAKPNIGTPFTKVGVTESSTCPAIP